jgi:hypothetical protein
VDHVAGVHLCQVVPLAEAPRALPDALGLRPGARLRESPFSAETFPYKYFILELRGEMSFEFYKPIFFLTLIMYQIRILNGVQKPPK